MEMIKLVLWDLNLTTILVDMHNFVTKFGKILVSKRPKVV